MSALVGLIFGGIISIIGLCSVLAAILPPPDRPDMRAWLDSAPIIYGLKPIDWLALIVFIIGCAIGGTIGGVFF